MIRKLIILLTVILLCVTVDSCQSDKVISVYCNEGNDLYQLLESNGFNCKIYEDINKKKADFTVNDIQFTLEMARELDLIIGNGE